MHGQRMPNPHLIYCSFWLETMHVLHSCMAYENEQDTFYQSLNPYVQARYRRLFKDDFMEIIKERDPGSIEKSLTVYKQHVMRTKSAF